jgi:hypothetical protein
MPTSGIRVTEMVWPIKSIKLEIDCLDGFSTYFVVTFMFMPSRFEVLNDHKKRRGSVNCHGAVTLDLDLYFCT